MAVLTEIRKKVPGVLVLLAGVLWAALIWRGYQAQIVAPGNVDTEVVMQYYDRSLRLVEAGQRGNAFEKWLVGAHEDEEWLRESADTIRELYSEDLGEEGVSPRLARARRLARRLRAGLVFPLGNPVGSMVLGHRGRFSDLLRVRRDGGAERAL